MSTTHSSVSASEFSQSIANLTANSLIKQRISHCHIRSHHQTALEATSVLVQTTISSQDLLGMGQDKPTIDSLTPSLSGPHQPWITGVLRQDLGVLPKTRKNETTNGNQRRHSTAKLPNIPGLKLPNRSMLWFAYSQTGEGSRCVMVLLVLSKFPLQKWMGNFEGNLNSLHTAVAEVNSMNRSLVELKRTRCRLSKL